VIETSLKNKSGALTNKKGEAWASPWNPAISRHKPLCQFDCGQASGDQVVDHYGWASVLVSPMLST
jgi:hypothetical protein